MDENIEIDPRRNGNFSVLQKSFSVNYSKLIKNQADGEG